jgi:membrane protein DedA with SNARE-associated domain
MLNNFFDWIMLLVEQLDYWNITLLMIIESSFVPFPSELVIPPAAYLAQQGDLNLILVITFGVLGSLLGALINYTLALSLGRKILYSLVNTKVAKFLLITEKKLKNSESYFLKRGEKSTFFGRLIPVVRQLISIPAGLSKMNIFKFCLYTFLGSSIWIIILALVGYYFAQQQAIILLYYKEIVVFVLVIILVVMLIRNRKRFNNKQTKKKEKPELKREKLEDDIKINKEDNSNSSN